MRAYRPKAFNRFRAQLYLTTKSNLNECDGTEKCCDSYKFNPITTDHTILRQSILPSLLSSSQNQHHVNFHNEFRNVAKLSVATQISGAYLGHAEIGTGFTGAKGIAQALMRDLGARDEIVSHPIEDGEGPWIPGRGAKIKVGDIFVGEFGEIDPTVSEKFGLKVPIQGGEFDVGAIPLLQFLIHYSES